MILNILFWFCLSEIIFVGEIPRNVYRRWWVVNASFKKITLAVGREWARTWELWVPSSPLHPIPVAKSCLPQLYHHSQYGLLPVAPPGHCCSTGHRHSSLMIPPKRPPTYLTQDTWLQTMKIIMGNKQTRKELNGCSIRLGACRIPLPKKGLAWPPLPP